MTRQSNFELLRIFCMIGIVLFHSLFHGNYNTDLCTVNNAFIKYMQFAGEVGVDVFVLITGYFLSNKEKINFNLQKLGYLFSVMSFYNSAIYTINSLCYSNFSVFIFLQNIALPWNWWFLTIYVMLLFVTPCINYLQCRITNKVYVIILLVGFVILSVFPTISGIPFFAHNYYLSRLFVFILLFAIGGYIRFHINKSLNNSYYRFIVISILVIVIVSEIVITQYFTIKVVNIPMFGSNVPYYYDLFYVPTIVISVMIFLLFVDIKLKSNVVNYIGLVTLDVYMLHDHPLCREFLWKKLIDLHSFQNEWYFFPLLMLIVICLYVVCSIVGYLRYRLFVSAVKCFH